MGRESSFGEQLRQLREGAGLTQEELAERAGLSAQAVGALERGDRQRPYPQTVRALADALGLDDETRGQLLAMLPRRRETSDSVSAPDAPSGRSSAISAPSPFVPAARLPATPTTLIGRERELAAARSLIEGSGARLLTITGPGGVGKTRLALQLAIDFRPHFEGRVAFVDLAPIRDPTLVLPHIGWGLGIHEAGERTIPEALAHIVGERRLLLVLDNLEHVLTAAADVATLLEWVPGLVILATSREPLRLRWEQEFPLAPLAVPQSDQPAGTITTATQPAVALLVERAQAVRPDFALNFGNTPAIAELCRRLDGLPLALELAAARLKILSPAALLARLEHRLDLLTTPVRDAPERHQTLRTAIGWSYELLTPEEQYLFGCLSIFVGGCTPEAVAAVCSGDEPADHAPAELLDRLGSLVDKNLLQAVAGPEGEPRFRMLETVGEYARDVLRAGGGEDSLRAAHACYMVAMVEAIEPQLWGPEQVRWIARLATEQENVRAALRWLLDHGDFSAAGRLLRRLHFFWWMQGQMVEARRWADDLLAHGDGLPPDARAAGHFVRGWAAIDLGDPVAETHLHESLTLARAVGDRWIEGHSLLGLGFLRPLHGDVGGGIALMWEGRRVFQDAGDEWGDGVALTGLSTLSVLGGLLDDAEAFAEEHVRLARHAGDLRSIGHALDDLAMVALLREDFGRAVQLYRESIALCTEVGQVELVAYGLMGLAVVAARDEPRRSVRLFGAAEMLREAGGVAIWPARRTLYDRALDIARDSLGEAAFDAEWAAGRSLSRWEAIAQALEEPAQRVQ
jgi:predicted ATPase/transcriptional regulator with XRE-family HTH domain